MKATCSWTGLDLAFYRKYLDDNWCDPHLYGGATAVGNAGAGHLRYLAAHADHTRQMKVSSLNQVLKKNRRQ